MSSASPNVRPIEIVRAAGVSMPYASMIARGEKEPSPVIALLIWRATGAKFGVIAGASDEDVKAMERVYAAQLREAEDARGEAVA